MNNVTLTLDQNDLAVIGHALGELPLKMSKATFDKINAQVAEASVPPTESDPPQD